MDSRAGTGHAEPRCVVERLEKVGAAPAPGDEVRRAVVRGSEQEAELVRVVELALPSVVDAVDVRDAAEACAEAAHDVRLVVM
jgi:hypothetical protein